MKKKNLLLNEATTKRMMQMANMGGYIKPFLKEQLEEETDLPEDDLGDDWTPDESDDDLFSAEEDLDNLDSFESDSDNVNWLEDESDDDLFSAEEDLGLGEDETEGSPVIPMEENLKKSMKRLKKLLEQAELGPQDDEETEELPEEDVPEPKSEAGGETEQQIKDFVKKLGGLIQDTLGVEVSVETDDEEAPEEDLESEDDLGMPPPEEEELPPPSATPEAMEEALNRLVKKVALRVEKRLMEAKKADTKKQNEKNSAAKKNPKKK